MGFKKRVRFSALGWLPEEEDTMAEILRPAALDDDLARAVIYDNADDAKMGGDSGNVRQVRATVTIKIEEV